VTGGADTTLSPLDGRVLLVDDEVILLEVAGSMLRQLGLQVEVATDGARAAEDYKQAIALGEPFGVVILDLTIRDGVGGPEALALLQAIDPKVRAVLASGYESDPVMAEYQSHGFVGRLVKPFRLEDLRSVLKQALTAVPPGPAA
jgi:CheY-like chemotaxis protein